MGERLVRLRGPLLLLMVVISRPLSAHADRSLPPDIQAVLLKKIFHYDKSFATASQSGKRVLLVGRSESDATLQKLQGYLQRLEITAEVTSFAKVEARATAGFAVVYGPDADQPRMQRLCAKYQLLSVTNSLTLVAQGAAAVGVGEYQKRPQIMIHVRRMKSDGHVLSPFLLQLARTIK